MIDPEKIIYSINIEDVQNVAKQELGRKLTAEELKLIEEKTRRLCGLVRSHSSCNE